MEEPPTREKTVKIAIDVEPERPPKRKRSAKDQCFYYFRKFVQFICSYIGLTSVLVGYVFVGALVFQSLEHPGERKIVQEVQWKREQLLVDFSTACISNPVNWTDISGRQTLLFYEAQLNNYITRHGYKYTGNNDPHYKWTFFGSLLFSLTIITTIGYGHITPVTWFGRIFCMFYALVGIPLMLLVLTNVGRLLANTAKLLYVAYTSKLCQQSRCCRAQRNRKMARGKSVKAKPKRKAPTRKKGKKGVSKKRGNNKNTKKEIALTVDEENTKCQPTLPKSPSDVGPTRDKMKKKKRPATIATADIKMMDPDKASRLAHYDRIEDLLKGSPGHSTGEEPSSVASSPARGLTIREAYAFSRSASNEGSASTPTSPQSERKKITFNAGDEETKSDTELEIAKSGERTAEASRQSNTPSSSKDENGDKKTNNDQKEKDESDSKSGSKSEVEKPKKTVELDINKDTGTSSLKRRGKKNHRSRSETRTKKDSYRSDSESDSRSGSWQRRRRRRLSSPGTGSRPSSIASLYSLELKVMDTTTALRLANYNKPDWSSRDDLDKALSEFSEDDKKSKSGDTPVKSDKKGTKKDKCAEQTEEKSTKDKKAEKRKSKIKSKSKESVNVTEPTENDENKTEVETETGNAEVSIVVPERQDSVKSNKKTARKRKSTAKKKSPKKTVIDDNEEDIAPTQGMDDLEADFSEEERARRRNDEFEVPITPVLVLFFSYILMGAILFSQLIDGWDIPIGIYFCFITLTTIGFGDFVPDDSLYSLVACTVYTMVGMAITSMCIALMIKKFVSSIRRVGRRIGLIKDEDEERDFEDR